MAKITNPINAFKWLFSCCALLVASQIPSPAQQVQYREASKVLLVNRCDDFQVNGKGTMEAWKAASWNVLTMLDSAKDKYETKFKVLYSTTGIYVLFTGQDKKITTQNYNDFDNIFNGDVFEVFFHPVPVKPVYFEYEVNAMEKELILAISNLKGHGNMGWVPRRSNIRKLVEVVGGPRELGSAITSWSAEIYFPYSVLGMLPSVPPSSGTEWNANFCRLDYDTGKMVKWSWSPEIRTSFHELEAFYAIKFE